MLSMIDRKAEFGHPIESQKNPTRRVSGLRGSARLLAPTVAMALALTVPTSANVKADEGGFTVDQSRVVRVYTQCGGDGYPDINTVQVQQVRNPDGYNTADLGKIAGQCDNRYTQPDSEIQNLAQVQYQQAHGTPGPVDIVDGRTFNYTRTYPQCGGSIGAMDIKPEYTVIIEKFIHPESGAKEYSWRTVGPQPGQCDNPWIKSPTELLGLLNFNPSLGFTAEAWIEPSGADINGYIISKMGSSQNGFSIFIQSFKSDPTGEKYTVNYEFGVVNAGNNCAYHRVFQQRTLSKSEVTSRQHVAGVIQPGGELDIFVNGLRSTINKNRISGVCPRDLPVYVGARQLDDGPNGVFNGSIEARLSKISRYPENFDISRISLSNDPSSIALATFNTP